MSPFFALERTLTDGVVRDDPGAITAAALTAAPHGFAIGATSAATPEGQPPLHLDGRAPHHESALIGNPAPSRPWRSDAHRRDSDGDQENILAKFV
jgi:hypothetical protein